MRVMLAPIESCSHPKFWDRLPMEFYASDKLDGIRGMVGEDGRLMSRAWKPLPSIQVQEEFAGLPPWIDGEFMEGPIYDDKVYNRTQGFVMSAAKFTDRLSYHVFDYAPPVLRGAPFEDRLQALKEIMSNVDNPRVHLVKQTLITNRAQLWECESEALERGAEGLIGKTQHGRYKEGRCTLLEGIAYKVKRSIDDEGVVVGFVERVINNNESKLDERGYKKKSQHKENLVPAGILGKFKVQWRGQVINVAPGHFTLDELREIWENKESYLGKLLKFRYFGHGMLNEPRHARALGWRSELDL